MKQGLWIGALIAMSTGGAVFAQGTVKPDPVAGQSVYKMQCAMCHATVAGKNGLGPSLAGISNRKQGAGKSYAYSPVMKAGKGKWDAATLDKYLAAPSVAMPGTKMVYVGQKDAKKRADLIAYLATLK